MLKEQMTEGAHNRWSSKLKERKVKKMLGKTVNLQQRDEGPQTKKILKISVDERFSYEEGHFLV